MKNGFSGPFVLVFETDFGSSAYCGYDRTSGVFTVRYPGVYSFTINLWQSEVMYAQLRIDEIVVCEAYSRHTVSCHVIQRLEKGQKVDVFLKSGRLNNPHDASNNQFHGVLLK